MCSALSIIKLFWYLIYNSDLISSYCIIVNHIIIITYNIHKVLIICLLSIMLVNTGLIALLLGIKVFICISLLIGNIIIVYLFSLISVIIYWVVYYYIVGILFIAYLYYSFITKYELFISILFLLELVSIIFQSLTLANRLSINLISGSLLITLLLSSLRLILLLISFLSTIISLSLIVHAFEILNSCIQLFIYHLLSIEYSLRHFRFYFVFNYIIFLVFNLF